MSSRAGQDLAMLLLAGFRSMIDETTEELARNGHPDVRASHEFAMQAILSGADSAIDLARSLSISKQGAAKTIATLEHRGYVSRRSDPGDARRKRLIITPRGHEMLALGKDILNRIHERWAGLVGVQRMNDIMRGLRTVVADPVDPLDTASWLARTSD